MTRSDIRELRQRARSTTSRTVFERELVNVSRKLREEQGVRLIASAETMALTSIASRRDARQSSRRSRHA